jgi:hypothetical protein
MPEKLTESVIQIFGINFTIGNIIAIIGLIPIVVVVIQFIKSKKDQKSRFWHSNFPSLIITTPCDFGQSSCPTPLNTNASTAHPDQGLFYFGIGNLSDKPGYNVNISIYTDLIKRPPAEAGGFEQLFVVRLPTDR